MPSPGVNLTIVYSAGVYVTYNHNFRQTDLRF
jgi:hypothetical protein